MTKNDLLEKYLHMAAHNMLCYSANYGMTEPRPGFEKEWQEANEEYDLLVSMRKELEQDKKIAEIMEQPRPKQFTIDLNGLTIASMITKKQKVRTSILNRLQQGIDTAFQSDL